MQFFDVNIPYLEGSPSDKTLAASADKAATKKKNRLKLVVKAMELGYSGVAYNRTISGIMSDSDRCSISLFPLSSLLKLSPSLSSVASFHRCLLGVSADSAFRQYTRLTVSVDSSSQASALNSGNSILKTYDLVAVQPLNQNAFEQACQFSEVDLIAIDFSDKLPFRLKLPMVKAAIKRGVYFEITYSGLIADPQVRRQLISNAKLLVDWTRGKNLIVSSSASSVIEFRGPNDVANLLSLLGLPLERSKAAISKNCSSLMINALRKKQFHKEVIRVEAMPSHGRSSSDEPWTVDWMKWDPISSGEGDLPLEDMAKSFSDVDKAYKAVKSIDFTTIVDTKPSSGLHAMDYSFRVGNLLHKTGGPGEAEEVIVSPGKHATLFHSTQLNNKPSNLEVSMKSLSQDSIKAALSFSKIGTYATNPEQELQYADSLVKSISPVDVHFLKLKDDAFKSGADMLTDKILKNASKSDVEFDMRPSANPSSEVSGLFKDLNLPAPNSDNKVAQFDSATSSVLSSMDVQVSTDKYVIDSSDQSLILGEGHKKTESKAALQDHRVMNVDIEACSQFEDLSLPSLQTDPMIVEIDGVVSGARSCMDVQVPTDADLIDLSDLSRVSLREVTLEGQCYQGFQTKAAMLADSITDTHNCPNLKNGNLASGNLEALLEEPDQKVGLINLMTDTVPALSSCGETQFHHGDKMGVGSDGPLDAFSLNEALLQEQNLGYNHDGANSLSLQETKPAVREKVKRRVLRQGFAFPFKHLLQVSFKRKASTRCKLRKS
ncbi:hypothetical protein Dimus_020443 [Dionaea muscipula]